MSSQGRDREREQADRAIRHRLLEPEHLEEGLKIQRALRKQGKKVDLFKILLKKEFITQRVVGFLQTGDGVGLDLEKPNHRAAIEGYELIEKFARGGTSTVYRAKRLENGEICAVKILFPHHTRMRKLVEGFLKEGELLLELDHPNLVRGYNAGQSKGLYYVAQEYVPGLTASNLIRALGTLSEELALHIVVQVCKALDYMAGQGVTHRDIKPGNILVDGTGTAKLCDLGFAVTAEDADRKDPGTTYGTVSYISPEQVGGRNIVDVRADIYSLGATMYHMVIGEVPFQRGSLSDVVHNGAVPTELSAHKVKSRDISHHMHFFLEKMMAEDREIRYESAAEVIEDIERILAGNRELTLYTSDRKEGDPLEELEEVFRKADLPGAVKPNLRRTGAGEEDDKRGSGGTRRPSSVVRRGGNTRAMRSPRTTRRRTIRRRGKE